MGPLKMYQYRHNGSPRERREEEKREREKEREWEIKMLCEVIIAENFTNLNTEVNIQCKKPSNFQIT